MNITRSAIKLQTKFTSHFISKSVIPFRKFSNASRFNSVSPKNLLQPQLSTINLQCTYAKSKNVKRKGDKPASILSLDDLGEAINVEKFQEDLKKVVIRLKEDLENNFSLRTSLGNYENLMVEYEGTTYPLIELCQVIRKGSNSVVINASAFPETTKNIMKALQNSGMNINPQQEGTTFFIQTPKVSKENRETLAKNCKVLVEKHRKVIRDIGSLYTKKVLKTNLSEDFTHNANLKVQEVVKDYQSQLDELLENKQKDILQS